MSNLLLGKPVAERIYTELKEKLSQHKESVRLVSILIGDDPSATQYARSKGKKAEKLGISFHLLQYPAEIEQPKVEQEIAKSLDSLKPDGVIIEKPIPKNLNFERLTHLIPDHADIDCQKFTTLGKLFAGEPEFVPATAGAVIEMLKFYDIKTSGKKVVLIGRSLTVGLPLARLLLLKGPYGDATLSICHSKTQDLSKETLKAEILIVAAGIAGLIKGDMVSNDAVVIDVGINYVNGKYVGDVDWDSVSQKVDSITPVPGGVGSVTTAYILRNISLQSKKNIA
jgi:methylenetetrahydrofolate dehydrogenase (NADP+)/methenyltetrahydrofolate cyclohydrolase